MKILRAFLVAFAIIYNHSPGYSQTASLSEGCIPLEVQFTAPEGSSSFFWDFKDGATSTIENPVNTYVNPGVYVVEFREGPGLPILGTVSITVFEKPELEITLDTSSGCIPLDVNFELTSQTPPGITINDYNWVFGDGGSAQGTPGPAHQYTTPGHFTVSLGITTNLESCNITEIFPELVYTTAPASVNIATEPDPAFACDPPLSVQFISQTTGGGNQLSYEWDFGNGNTFQGINPPGQVYDQNGQFEVILTVSDENACVATNAAIVRIGAPIASFVLEDTVCVGDTTELFNTSDPGTYVWEFDAGTEPMTSTEPVPMVVFNTKGWHEITLAVTTPDGLCTGDTTVMVYADQADASFVTDPTYSCSEPTTFTYTPLSNEAVFWFWIFNDGSSSMAEMPSFTFIDEPYLPTSSYARDGYRPIVTQLVVANASGCRATIFKTDTLYVPDADFLPDRTAGCAPLTVNFSDLTQSVEPVVSWEWDYGDGTTAVLDSGEPHDHIYTEPGEYEVQLNIVNQAGCFDTSYIVIIEVGAALAPDFEVDQVEVCPGDTVHFTDITGSPEIDAWHFETDDGRSFHCFQEPELNWTFDAAAGPMDVSLTVEYNGCLSTITKEDLITVKGPIARIDYEMDCLHPYDVIFRDSSREATTLSWDFGDGTSSSLPEPVHTYPDTGNYLVTLTAENAFSGCPASVDSVLICIRDVSAQFSLPERICRGSTLLLDGSQSADVNADCWKGYTWFFDISGRPITTMDSIIEFSFPAAGQETVALVTEDINGCTDTLRQELRVYGVEAAIQASDLRICTPGEVSFTDLSIADTTLVSWNWNFGDGTQSSEQNPVHEFEAASYPGDSIQVHLFVQDALGCPGQGQLTLTVYEPVSNITTDPEITNICVGTEITFFATDFTQEGSNLSFFWDFGNGDTADNQTAVTSYNDAGTFQAIMFFEELSSGCQGSRSQIVDVQDFPEAAFTSSVDNEPIICYPQSVFFTDNSISDFNLSYFWDFGNGQNGSGPNPAASFDKGTFTITLTTATSYGCQDTTSKSITLVGPEGDFGFFPEEVCKGDSITFILLDTVDVRSFSWNFGDGTGADDISPVSHAYDVAPPSGETPVTLVLRGENEACTFNVQRPVSIRQVIADFIRNNGVDTSLCIGEYPFFNNSTGADILSWDFGNDQLSSAEDPVINYEDPGTYLVQLAVSDSDFGCTDTVVKTITVFELPDILAVGDTICLGDTAVLRLAGNYPNASLLWSPAQLLDDPFSGMPRTSPVETTVFDLDLVDENGCAGSSSATVFVVSPLQAAGLDTIVLQGVEVTLDGPPVDELHRYSWSPPDGLSCDDCPSPQLIAGQDVSYTLLIQDLLGCEESTYIYNIEVVTEQIELPNIFTPNNDGRNDFFNILSGAPINSDYLQLLDFKVFNRWGQLVYNNDRPMTGWNGTHDGNPAPSDVYVYVIRLRFVGSGKVQEFKGDVTLLR